LFADNVGKRFIVTTFLILSLLHISRAQFIYPPAIQCVQQDVSNGDIILYWTNPTNDTCGAFVGYTIYGSSTGVGGPYDSLTTITSEAATLDTLNNFLAVSQNWYFYMVAVYDCPGATTLISDTVLSQNPATPNIVAVTVLDGQAEIIWDPSTSQQVNSYVAYYYLINNGFAQSFDTVYGRLDTTVIDVQPGASPTTQSLSFTVAAKDSCNNISAYNKNYQSTIYTTAIITECERQLNIAWNKYVNWPKGVLKYIIWVNRNGAGYDSVFVGDSSSVSYPYTGFNDGDSISVYVEAISAADTNITSNSNVITMKAQIVQPPSYIYITNLTVDANNDINVSWTVDTAGQLLFYEMWRSADSTQMQVVTQFGVPSPTRLFETFVDSDDEQPQYNPYYYQVVVYDSCQNQYKSPFGKTIWLQGVLYDYFVAHLNWNDFELQNATVLQYNLYRDYGAGYQLIKSFPPGINSDIDSLENLLSTRGTFCYYVQAVYYLNLPAPSGFHDTLTSNSNTVCIVHVPVIYIPNAFSPGSNVEVNSVFKPTIIYGDPQDYSMTIFNRWGAEIFTTNNLNQGWDGTDHGKEATMGGYAYLIQFTADDGVVVRKNGIVLLVR
jgi:gliding motility-associated-like protein